MITDEQFREKIREERRGDLALAAQLFRAAEAGNVGEFELAAAHLSELSIDGWRLAFLKLARLPSVTEAIQWAFLATWVQHKGFSYTVTERAVVARALRIMVPRSPPPSGEIVAWRGASATERRKAIYGFSWSTERDIARRFALYSRQHVGGAVLLETRIPADAVLHVRERGTSYDEAEIIVDPYRLNRVKLRERIPNL